jgi:hypothetical protein|tara:strand:- start:8594 stop:8821 length:228 start_codon:yes stop_codon:yes gene_type:complete
MIKLGRKQRNFMNYVWHHWKHQPSSPCFVPKSFDYVSLQSYINMLESLEKKNLIQINRTGSSYRAWIISKPKPFG